MMYCPHCQAMTGALDARPEWYSPLELRCSRCGRLHKKESDDDDDEADGIPNEPGEVKHG